MEGNPWETHEGHLWGETYGEKPTEGNLRKETHGNPPRETYSGKINSEGNPWETYRNIRGKPMTGNVHMKGNK